MKSNVPFTGRCVLRIFPALFLLLTMSAAAQGWQSLPLPGLGVPFNLGIDQQSKTLYCVGNGTLLRSTDGGKSWTYHPFPYSVDNSLYVKNLYVHSADTICIFPEYGMIFSGDGGKTFESRVDSLHAYSSNNQRFAVSHTRTPTFWSLNTWLFKSTNFGASWELSAGNNVEAHGFHILGADPADSVRVYLLSNDYQINNERLSFLYTSTNTGDSWKPTGASFRGSGSSVLNVTPSSAIYINDYASFNHGKSFVPLTKNNEEHWINKNRVTLNNAVYNPKDSCLYFADEEGLMKIRDGETVPQKTEALVVWVDADDNMQPANGMYPTSIAIDTTDNVFYVHIRDSLFIGHDPDFTARQTMYAQPASTICGLNGAADTLLVFGSTGHHRSTDGGATWRMIRSMSNLYSRYSYWQSPRFPQLLVFEDYQYDWYCPHFSTDYGCTWHSYQYAFVPSTAGLHSNPFEPGAIYGVNSNTIWKTYDTTLLNGPPYNIGVDTLEFNDEPVGCIVYPDNEKIPLDFEALSFAPHREGLVYAAGNDFAQQLGRFYRSEDGMHTWTQLFPDWVWDIPKQISLNPADTNDILVMFNLIGFLRSTDAGNTWIVCQDGLYNTFIKQMTRDPEHPNYIYAASRCVPLKYRAAPEVHQGGVYESTDGGSNWRRLTSEGLNNWYVNSVQLIQQPRSLLIATECGIYTLPLPEIPVGVENEVVSHQANFVLSPAYPNPFSGSTTITYSLPAQQHISLNVYNTLGRKVQTLYSGLREPGTHTERLDASTLPAGMYRVVLRSGEGVKSRTVVVR